MLTISLDGILVVFAATAITLVVSLAACRALAIGDILPDNPNHRSSHSQVVSRAGGIAIFGAFTAGLFIIAVYYDRSLYFGDATLLFLSGFGAFLIGVLDDAFGLRAAVKLLAQVLIALIFAFFAGVDVALAPKFFGIEIAGAIGGAVAVLWIVGMMNAYNFMDGSNGLAAGTGLIGLCALAAFCAISGAIFPAIGSLVLATALFGFLPQNLLRGRLFMGDGGSQSVSFLIAAIAVLCAGATDGEVNVLIAGIIFLPLIADVTLTLGHRSLRGENVLEAHREHVYQLYLRRGRSHAYVAILYMSMTAVCVAVAAAALTFGGVAQWAALIFAGVVWVVFGLRAIVRGYAEGCFAPATDMHREIDQ